MLDHLRPAVVLAALMTLLLGVVYPLAVTAYALSAVPDLARGSPVVRDGAVVGSRLVGQGFADPRWFHPRASAAGDGYDAAASSGANLGVLASALQERVREARAALPPGPVPADAVTASASGLDPHVSPAFARLQVPRVAQARGLPEARVAALVEAAIERPALGFIGEPRVNVLLLNLALDQAR